MSWEAKRGHAIAVGTAQRRVFALVRALVDHWEDVILREELKRAIEDLDRLGPVGR